MSFAAGQERFRTLTSSYYRGAQRIILGICYQQYIFISFFKACIEISSFLIMEDVVLVSTCNWSVFWYPCYVFLSSSSYLFFNDGEIFSRLVPLDLPLLSKPWMHGPGHKNLALANPGLDARTLTEHTPSPTNQANSLQALTTYSSYLCCYGFY